MDRREAMMAMGLGALAASQVLYGATPAAAADAEADGADLLGVQGGRFALPPLPYAYSALEPHIDEQTMRLHHDKHHAGYVSGANTAMDELKRLRRSDDKNLISHWEQQLAFHGCGHVLHTLFWYNMAPDPGEPSEAFAEAVERDYGGMENLKAQFAAASRTVQASGWGMLAYHPMTDSLMALQIEKHQNHALHGAVPLLVLDVWEHAYYLKYQNERGRYVEAFMNVANWRAVSRRYEAAKRARQAVM